ncbi:MAG TPA: DUF4349 domain-containing protein [Pyrinomonadaceae bacterium]|nr:DUF4349 domain-containing protein [Pyrinomonadaceae bacterium]
MKSLFLVLPLLLVAGCGQQEPSTRQAAGTTNTSTVVSNEQVMRDQAGAGTQSPMMQQVSLSQADQSQSMAEAMNRKILRNAELTLEAPDPGAVQRNITSIAESLGGFVVTSESKQRQTRESGQQQLEVNVVVRVPAPQFGAALDQIRALGGRVIQEKATGQDVTEEFIDLEARIKTQKALELQFLEIMKQANKVADALEVQRQIADVRTEIEKLEGRKRFLENRASLSTITVNLQTPAAISVSTSSFGRNVREAVGDSVSVATGIVLFLIRFVIVMVPIFILIIIPGGLLVRYIFRKAKRMQLSPRSSSTSAD